MTVEMPIAFRSLINIVIALFTIIGCRDKGVTNTSNTIADTTKAVTTISQPVQAVPAAIDTMAAASLEYCNCLRQTMGSFSPEVERLILKSIKQPQPLQYLENEIAKMTDPASQQQAIKDLETFSNFDAASPCISSVSRKYRVDETDPASLQRMIHYLEQYPDCKLVTALFKIAYAEEVPK